MGQATVQCVLLSATNENVYHLCNFPSFSRPDGVHTALWVEHDCGHVWQPWLLTARHSDLGDVGGRDA